MKQGSNNALKITINDLIMSNISSIVFTFKATKSIKSEILIQKTFTSTSTEVTYDSTGAYFIINFSQTETRNLDKEVYLQAQINYADNSVDFSDIAIVDIKPSLNIMVIDDE